MMRVAFTIVGPTVGVNATYHRGKGRGFYKSAEAKAWRELIRFAAGRAMTFPLLSGPCSLTVRWFFQSAACDNDGPVKPLKDALQGVVYANDRQVKVEHYEWNVDREHPRAEVVVEEMAPGAASTPEALRSILGEKAKTKLMRAKGRLVKSTRDYRRQP